MKSAVKRKVNRLNGCSCCTAVVDPRILLRTDEVTPAVARLIDHACPTWRTAGVCPQCVLLYARRLASERHAASLHTTTDPHTTFPYYHAAEETVLSQPQRLADYPTFDGRDVTIAFLDSGFYPHPDLLAFSAWAGDMPPWERLDLPATRALLEGQPSRLIHYVDLTDGVLREGTDLASLWDAAGYSWHGQMTSVIAAGNGLLSQGHFRGFAPRANVLPIKVGRSDGRIPEACILAGLQWLLQDNNWQRYNVRVVNISVGGDYPQAWGDSDLALAAEQLSAKGVLVAAAAGNSGRRELLPPAQAPSVLTVGGYDDVNRGWNYLHPAGVRHLQQYHHNYGSVVDADGLERDKPEILGLANFMPSPILPATPTFREVHAIARMRRTLSGADDARAHELLEHWQRIMHVDDPRHPQHAELAEIAAGFQNEAAQSLYEIWRALRKRMNAHKWVHDYYQHVDGTSVAVAQVSAVAAQMFQANPRLSGRQVKALLLATAFAMPQWPREQRGAGILQPAAAVAAALRAPGGLGANSPHSATQISESRLRKWVFQGKVPRTAVLRRGRNSAGFVYFGLYAPKAHTVSLIGSFNGWTPGLAPLTRGPEGWWHAALEMAPGEYLYRFWITDAAYPLGEWRLDPENPIRIESGYLAPHNGVLVY